MEACGAVSATKPSGTLGRSMRGVPKLLRKEAPGHGGDAPEGPVGAVDAVEENGIKRGGNPENPGKFEKKP